MMLQNLTPHTLNMVETFNPATGRVENFDLEPHGLVARVEEKRIGEDGDGIAILSLGEVIDLPEPAKGTTYVVSRPLAQALLGLGVARRDVLVVDRMVRDDSGRIIGASGFARLTA